MSVLILDDDPAVLGLLSKLFQNEPFPLFLTTRYEEAIELLEKEKIKLVISDQRMPIVSGISFLKQVKDLYPSAFRMLLFDEADAQVVSETTVRDPLCRLIKKPWNDIEFKIIVTEALRYGDIFTDKKYLLDIATTQNKHILDVAVKQNEQLKAENERLAKTCGIQSDFTSTVSHELRSPLSSIKMAIDTVIEGRLGKLNEKQAGFLGIAKRNVDRLHRLVTGILDLRKMELGKETFKIEEVDLNQLLRDACEIQKSVAEKKGLYLKAVLNPEIKRVQIDADKIAQVLSNLINNAIKFTAKGGITISSTLEAAKNQVKISVQDTGPGIRKEDKSKLFQKFKQIGKSSAEAGTGLGLAISKEIAILHKGDIQVDSEVGRGTIFSITLPISQNQRLEPTPVPCLTKEPF